MATPRDPTEQQVRHSAAFRSYGNELREFDDNGLMRRREASINDVAINEADRRWHGIRPESSEVSTAGPTTTCLFSDTTAAAVTGA